MFQWRMGCRTSHGKGDGMLNQTTVYDCLAARTTASDGDVRLRLLQVALDIDNASCSSERSYFVSEFKKLLGKLRPERQLEFQNAYRMETGRDL